MSCSLFGAELFEVPLGREDLVLVDDHVSIVDFTKHAVVQVLLGTHLVQLLVFQVEAFTVLVLRYSVVEDDSGALLLLETVSKDLLLDRVV